MIGKQRESKVSNGLYEQVLTKNFQIIQTFLSQFTQIFQKQDQFEAALTKIQYRQTQCQKMLKKQDDNITRSIEMQQNKMKSLKQFILEKLKNSGQKLHSLTMKMIAEESTQQNNEQGKQRLAECEKQLNNQKKLQQNVNENIKRLQGQLSALNLKINSITSTTNSLEQRVDVFSTCFQQRNIGVITIKQLQQKIQSNAQLINRKIKQHVAQITQKFMEIQSKVSSQIPNFKQNIQKLLNEINVRTTNKNFNQFKQTYKKDQACLVKQINQTFMSKKQSKKMSLILQKRITKLQMIEEMLKQSQQRQTSAVSTPNSLTVPKRTNYNTIHSACPQKFLKEKQIKQIVTNSAISVRRLSCRKSAMKLL